MSIICSRCDGTNIMCEAMIEPNTKKFCHYTDESFLYGWCNDCWKGTVLTDVEEVKNYITTEYQIFVESFERILLSMSLIFNNFAKYTRNITMIGINKDSIQLAKEQKIDCIDGWVNILAILVYIDIFLGIIKLRGESIERILDNFSIGYLIQFIIGAIICIIIIKWLTIVLYILYSMIIANYVDKLFPDEESQESSVSVFILKEYAMITNNDVIARIADEAEKMNKKKFRNRLTIVGTLILICFDFCLEGAFIPKMATNPFDCLAVIVLCVFISLVLMHSLYRRNNQVFIYSNELLKKIVGDRNSIIKDE